MAIEVSNKVIVRPEHVDYPYDSRWAREHNLHKYKIPQRHPKPGEELTVLVIDSYFGSDTGNALYGCEATRDGTQFIIREDGLLKIASLQEDHTGQVFNPYNGTWSWL